MDEVELDPRVGIFIQTLVNSGIITSEFAGNIEQTERSSISDDVAVIAINSSSESAEPFFDSFCCPLNCVRRNRDLNSAGISVDQPIASSQVNSSNSDQSTEEESKGCLGAIRRFFSW